MTYTAAVVTELRAQITALKLKSDKFWNRITYYRVEIVRAREEKAEAERKYKELYESMRVIGNSAIITHLETEIRERDAVIEKYQTHYQKWGKFYAEYQEKHI